MTPVQMKATINAESISHERKMGLYKIGEAKRCFVIPRTVAKYSSGLKNVMMKLLMESAHAQ